MSSSRGAHIRPEKRRPGQSVPTLMTLAVLPLIILILAVGGLLIWAVMYADSGPGFSSGDWAAAVAALLLLAMTARSLIVIRRTGNQISSGVEEVTDATRKIAQKDLVALVGALSEPEPSKVRMRPLRLSKDGPAELAELAASVEELHSSLGDVASAQMETLKGGVSSLLVTLAERNASLIDRQLGLLDEIQMEEHDPKTLASYFMVDHLATRMRRNAETLMVLAGEEPPRVWPKSMEMADVVRAAVSEVDEYQRIGITALEPAQLHGGAVADVAHLLAELLENATRFSPSGQPVTVKSSFGMDGYQLTIADRGPGMTNEEIAQLNKVLSSPPALGLDLGPTMGMYIISKLAGRHGIAVELIPGIPGLIARVTIPRHLLEVHPGAARTRVADSRPIWPSPQAAPAAVPAGEDRVIDLTEGAGHLQDKPVAGEDLSIETDSLSVRSPGETPVGESTVDHPVVEGSDAVGIKSALEAYGLGRKAAMTDEPVEESVTDHGLGSEPGE